MEAHAFLNPLHHSKQLCKSELQSKCRASCHIHFTSAAPALRGQWTVGPLGKCKIIMVAQRVAKWGPLGTKLGAVGPLSISSYVCQIMDSAHRTVGPLSRPLTSKSVAAVPSKAGHGHCKTADPRNYNCHTWGTPNHCLGNGSSCSGAGALLGQHDARQDLHWELRGADAVGRGACRVRD